MIVSIHSAYFLIAALIDIALALFMGAKGIQNRYLYALIIIFFSMNLMFLGFSFLSPSNIFLIELLFRLFYVGLFLSAGCFLSYAMQISTTSNGRAFTKQIENGIWIVALCGSLLVIFSDEIVQGYKHIPNSVTAIQGGSYWVVVIHSFMALLTSGVVLTIECLKLPAGRQKQRCFLALIAYLVHIICALSVVFMMRFGIDTNFSATLPFSTIISVCLFVYGELNYAEFKLELTEQDQDKMSDTERLNDIFQKYTRGVYTFTEATEKLDFLLLMHAYNKHDGNMTKTANAMGLGRSTLYKKVNKYGLK